MPKRSAPVIENYLLDAVHALTKPVVNKIIQDGPIGSGLAGQTIATSTQPPLLTQLDEAIGGTIGIGGSKSLASQRSVLDADALYRFTLISSTVKDWCRMVGATVTNDASTNLTAWYLKYDDRTTGAGSRFYTSQLTGWKTQIESKLDPPRIRELPDRCPVCDANLWYDPSDKLPYLHPLIVKYKPTGPDMIQQAEALCRACGQTWGVRELAYQLEQANAEDETEDTPIA